MSPSGLGNMCTGSAANSIDEDLMQHRKIGGDDRPPVGYVLKRRPGVKVVLDTGEAV
jgi:hypothetical protein